MNDGVDGDAIPGRLAKYFERKPPHERTSELIQRRWIEMWMALDAKHTCLDATQEIFSKSRFAALVPTVGLRNFPFGFRQVNNPLNHSAPAPAL